MVHLGVSPYNLQSFLYPSHFAPGHQRSPVMTDHLNPASERKAPPEGMPLRDPQQGDSPKQQKGTCAQNHSAEEPTNQDDRAVEQQEVEGGGRKNSKLALQCQKAESFRLADRHSGHDAAPTTEYDRKRPHPKPTMSASCASQRRHASRHLTWPRAQYRPCPHAWGVRGT